MESKHYLVYMLKTDLVFSFWDSVIVLCLCSGGCPEADDQSRTHFLVSRASRTKLPQTERACKQHVPFGLAGGFFKVTVIVFPPPSPEGGGIWC